MKQKLTEVDGLKGGKHSITNLILFSVKNEKDLNLIIICKVDGNLRI